MSDHKDIDELSGVETTGHEWDGIKELNKPLPRWWLWTFYATIVWAIGYSIYYPAWPMFTGATPGTAGWASRQDVAQDIEANKVFQQKWVEQIDSSSLEDIVGNEELNRFATAGGAATFRTYCSQCHGSGAAGATGYPNLLDDDWLWGGTLDDIQYTVTHGIRNDSDEDARYSQMPAFGADELLSNDEIAEVVEYVREISGQEHDAAKAQNGAVLFADNCSVCHAEDGTGDVFQGAPNLTDAIWLYGGDRAALSETIHNARFGIMPNWNTRLTDAQIKQVTVYVHGLGGGE